MKNTLFFGLKHKPYTLSDLHIIDASDVPGSRGHYYHGKRSIASGPVEDAASILNSLRQQYGPCSLALMTWLLGAHMKAHFGIWPHLVACCEHDSVDSLLHRIGQVMPLFPEGKVKQQPFFQNGWQHMAIFRSVCDTTFPVLIDATQVGADNADKLANMLYSMKHFAPMLVLGAVKGEEVVSVACELCLPDGQPLQAGEDLPPFPMWQWLLYLSTFNRRQLLQRIEHIADPWGYETMLLLAWEMLCDFSGIEDDPEVRQVIAGMEITWPAAASAKEVAHGE